MKLLALAKLENKILIFDNLYETDYSKVQLILQKKCRHAFCHGCAKKASGVCPKCKEGDQTFEEASMGSVHICTHSGGRWVWCIIFNILDIIMYR